MRIDKDSLRSRAGDCGENDLVAQHLVDDRNCDPMTAAWVSAPVWKTWGMVWATKSRRGYRVTCCRSIAGALGGNSGPVFPGLNRLSTETGVLSTVLEGSRRSQFGCAPRPWGLLRASIPILGVTRRGEVIPSRCEDLRVYAIMESACYDCRGSSACTF